MANIFGIEVSGNTYDLEDSQARQDTEQNAGDIGNLATLITTAKNTVVAAINELAEKVSNLLNGNDWVTLANGIEYKVVGKTVFVHISTQTCYFPDVGRSMKDGNGEDIILPQAVKPIREQNVFICNNGNDTVWRFRITRYGTLISWNMRFQEQTFELPLNTSNWQGDFSYRLD